MKFRVIGHRKDNAHRVTLEFEAQSKAQAEREAVKQNIEVVRVEIVQGEGGGTYGVGQAASEGQVRRGKSGGGGGKLLVLLVLLAVLAGAAYYFWPTIKGMIPGLH